MPDDDSVIRELDEGELIEVRLASEDHGFVVGNLVARLWNFARAHDLGRVYSGDTGFRLSDVTVRGPDVSFVGKERVEALRSQGFARGAPDLAVEILLPSNRSGQPERKIQQHFAAGCRMVWIVDCEQRRVEVLAPDGNRRRLGAEDRLEAPDLLPGFSLRVADIFEA
jgi:Uma2 family endonuclease